MIFQRPGHFPRPPNSLCLLGIQGELAFPGLTIVWPECAVSCGKLGEEAPPPSAGLGSGLL